MRDLDFMWRGGNVKRFHTHKLIGEDTVGHHSFNVAAIIMHLRPEASAALLRAALLHDVAEWVMGDMPAPAKRNMPDYEHPDNFDGSNPPRTFREVFGQIEEQFMEGAGLTPPILSPAEAWVLKLADSLDGMRLCIQERRLGNQGVAECYENFRAYVSELIFGSDIGVIEQLHTEPVEFAQRQDLMLAANLGKEWYNVHGK